MQEDHYYPFGLTLGGLGKQGSNPFKYNGKEIQDELNLGWMDYGARMYDTSLGRFNSIDPHANSYYSQSPYQYVFNNPVMFVDPTGMDGIMFLQVLTDPNGNVSQATRDLVDKAIQKITSELLGQSNVDVKIKLTFSNVITSKANFEARADYHVGDTYTLIGTNNQLKSAWQNAVKQGWEDQNWIVNGNGTKTVSGTSGTNVENFTTINLDNVVTKTGSVRNSSFEKFLTPEDKLSKLIQHEVGHDKLLDHPSIDNSGHVANSIMSRILYPNRTYDVWQRSKLWQIHGFRDKKRGPVPFDQMDMDPKPVLLQDLIK